MESILSLRIESLAFGGDGVGRADGKVCFVPYSAPGDLLSVRVVEDHGSFLRGEILEVREPGPSRRAPRCRHFGRCGGCSWQHIDYGTQLEAKRRNLAETMKRIGGLEAEVRPPIASAEEYGYRTRARLHAAGAEIGYFARSSKRVVDITECPILAPSLEARLAELKRGRLAPPSGARTAADASLEIELDGPAGALARDGALTDSPLGGRHGLRRGGDPGDEYAFHQVNRFVNGELTRIVARAITDRAAGRPPLIIDLYCGDGNLSLPVAAGASSVSGFDTSEESIRRAAQSARSAGLENTSYSRMDAARGLASLEDRLSARDPGRHQNRFLCIIADPPRSGLRELARTILAIAPELFIYVSCNPPALARDSRLFVDGGMQLELLQPLDMFPQTSHLETVALLSSPSR